MANKENVSLVKLLAEKLGVDLRDSSFAVATPRQDAFARTSSGSLDVAVRASMNDIFIETPSGPGVQIQLVDSNNPYFALAPKDAFFAIQAYKPNSEHDHIVGDCKGESLNHHIATIYVSRDGLVLNSAGLLRAAKLHQKERNS